MAYTEAQKIKLANLELSIEELRRKDSDVSDSYDSVRTRVLALIAAELTILTFFFASDTSLPRILYGLIFFAIGVLCLLVSFGMLMRCIMGVQWRMPSDRDELKTMLDKKYSEIEFKEKIEDSYRQAINHNLPILAAKGSMFNKSLMLMLAGAIILIVLKYGKVWVL